MLNNKKTQIIEVVAYNPNWPKLFAAETAKIQAIFADNFVKAHHIGSTAVPNLAAKPTIDILIEVKSIAAVDLVNQPMALLGCEAWGEYQIPGRRFFVKGKIKREYHVHVFEYNSPEINRHLYFRDYLILHPKIAQQYANLKIELANKFRHDRHQYFLAKQSFIKRYEQAATDYFEEKLS